MKRNRDEILRYLGVRGAEPGEQLDRLIDDACAELEREATPRLLTREAPLAVFPEEDTVCFLGMMVQSRGLSRHLAGCDEIILFAATLGAGVDRLIQRASVADMGRAVVLQACAASMIESYCDERQAQLLENYLVQGRHFKPRFSPGYADFSLTYQRDILQLLDAPKRMGLTATESCMLAPTKSVTAIIGVTQGKAEAAADKCESCPAVDCPYRKGNDR